MEEIKYMLVPVQIPTGNLLLDIRYYDEEEKEKFQKKYPNYEDIDKVVNSEAKISAEEFLTYMLFVEKSNRSGFQTFQELARKVPARIQRIQDYLEFENGSVRTKVIGKGNRCTEEYGVGFSLSAMALVHNDLHEADWHPIPEVNSSKTTDFKIASDGGFVVFVECKGTSNKDNKKKEGSSASGQKSDIEKKKGSLPPPEESSKYLAYGTIAVLDNRKNSTPIVWLVDPPAPILALSPRKYKLLARLNFYLSNLREISSRMTLVTALTNRLRSIFLTQDYEKLDGGGLQTGKGEPIIFAESTFSNKSIVKDPNYSNGYFEKVVGKVYVLDGGKQLVYIGFQREVFDIMAKQEFQDILTLKFTNTQRVEEVICRFTKKAFSQLDKSSTLVQKAKKQANGYYAISLYFHLVYAQSGRVYGVWVDDVHLSQALRLKCTI